MKWKTGNVFIEGMVDYDKCLPALHDWFYTEMAELDKSDWFTPDELAIVLGCPVWGEAFVNRFLDICIPSLLARKNRAALCGHAKFILFTTAEYLEVLCQGIGVLELNGMEVEIHLIPDHLIGMLDENPLNKYWLLGTVQNLIIQIARRKGMGFHMLMPDHLYSEEYFSNLFRLAKTHEAIAQTTISGDIEPCMREIEAYRENGVISIPGQKLGDIVYRHMHQQNRGVVMNNRDYPSDMPDSHFYFYVGKDALHIYCCHMSIAYMSPQLVRNAPIRLHNAVDVELPSFMPGEVYVPTLQDNMCFTELSDDTKGANDKRVPFTQFALRCWMTVFFLRDYERFFAMKNVMPIGKQYEYMDDDKINAVQSAIFKALIDSRDEIHDTFKQVSDEHEKEAA